MLEGLDRIDWRKLEHAHGPAAGLPDLIRALASADAQTHRRALEEFFGSIWNQGTVYEATSYAVPFLIELLEEPAVAGKDQILNLLASVATATPYLRADDEFAKPMLATRGRDFHKELDMASAWAQRAHQAARDGILAYLKLLGDPDFRVRMGAAYVLSCFPQSAAMLTPRLRSRLNLEKDKYVKASLLLSLGALAEGHPDWSPVFDSVVHSKANLLLRIAAAIGLAGAAKGRTPREAIDLLAEACHRPELVAFQYSELPWLGDLVADACTALRHAGPGLAVPALIRALDRSDDEYDALEIARALLDLSFPVRQPEVLLAVWRAGDSLAERSFQRKPVPDGARRLTAGQRRVLASIARCEIVWDLGSTLFDIYGLPNSRVQLRAILEEG